MKLCEICDNPIKGRWCKNCHRFVTGYESNLPVYRCEEETTSMVETKSELTEKEKTKVSKRTKGAICGISWLVILSFLIPYVPDIIDTVKMMFDYTEKKQEEKREFFEEVTISEEEMEEYGDKIKREAALQGLTPAERVIEKDSSLFYYNPEDIKAIGYACDETHLELYFKEFEQWLNAHWTDVYEYEDDSSVYSNQCHINGDDMYFQFATYRNYWDESGTMVRVEYDTGTEQLHSVFISTREDVPVELGYGLLKQLKPETQWIEEKFAEELQKAMDGEEAYTVFCREEGVIVALIKGQDDNSLGYISVE